MPNKPERSAERLCLIVNPKSAGGATGRRMQDLSTQAAKWFSDCEIRETMGPRHGQELARQAGEEGFDLVVAVGGDGTASEVMSGFFHEGRNLYPRTIFSVIPAGTGSDLIRTLRMPQLPDALRALVQGETRSVDVMEVRFLEEDKTWMGINVIGFGLNGEVVKMANESSKRWGGTATFLGATLRALSTYEATATRVVWKNQEGEEGQWQGRLLAGFVANGQYCGGGMKVGGTCTMTDGLLQMVLIPEMSWVRLLRRLPHLYSGSLEKVPGIISAPVVELNVHNFEKKICRVDVDGEQPGILPVSIRTIKKSLLVRSLW